MNKARAHASSCTVTPMLEPMDAVFLSILVEQEKEIISFHETIMHVPSGNYVSCGNEHVIQYFTVGNAKLLHIF